MTKNILLLEDDSVQLEVLKNYVVRNFEDVEVHCYTSADDAFDALNSDVRYDIFLLDISLDEKSVTREGIDFAKKIRADKNYLKTPVIFITGYPEFIFDAVNEAHCYSYIIKPYDEDKVISQLSEVLSNNSKVTIRTTDKVYVNLDLNDIYYIESMGRYQYFHT